MTLREEIERLSDGGSAQVIADKVNKMGSDEEALLFIQVCLKKAADGHHQTREFALAALKVLAAQ